MIDVSFDQVLPVLTLLLGAGIGWIIKRSEVRRSETIEAGDLLSELPNYIWRQGGDDSWINLQVFLSRLRIRLRAAGVPDVVVKEVQRAAKRHWNSAEEADTPDGVEVLNDQKSIDGLERATDDAQLWLFGTRNVLKRRRARSRLDRGVTDAD